MRRRAFDMANGSLVGGAVGSAQDKCSMDVCGHSQDVGEVVVYKSDGIQIKK